MTDVLLTLLHTDHPMFDSDQSLKPIGHGRDTIRYKYVADCLLIRPTKLNAPSSLVRAAMTQSHPSDPRSRLPLILSRFLGYRPGPPPYEPLPFPPFTYLHHIPIVVEIWLFAFIGSFISILLIQSVMITPTDLREWGAPFIITSFGASAVLVFGVIESPLAQPMNLVAGQMIAAVIGVGLTKLFMLGNEEEYEKSLDGQGVYPGSFVNGGLSMALTLLAQQVLGITHPP